MNFECSFKSGGCSFFTSVDLWDESFGGLVRRMITVEFECSFGSGGGEVFSPVFVTFIVFAMY